MARTEIDRQRVITLSVDVFISIGLIALFLWLSLRIVAPFVSVLIWAVILAVALYPVFERLRGWLGGRSGRAAALIGLLGLIVIIGPTILVVQALIESVAEWAGRLQDGKLQLPPPPDGVADWPLIGGWLHATWSEASANLGATAEHYAPEIRKAGTAMLGTGAGLLVGVLQFALSVVFAAAFLAYSGPLSRASALVAGRVSDRGQAMLEMAGATIRNVSRGVLGVAVIQGGLAAIGIIAAGLPFAGFLAVAVIGACIVQVPPLVIVPLIVYVWSAEPTTVALIFTAYMVPVLFLDNVLKPILMARGLTTPMVVILIGVIGGTLSSGLLGLFIGPVILALFYEMVVTWVAYGTEREERAQADARSDGDAAS